MKTLKKVKYLFTFYDKNGIIFCTIKCHRRSHINGYDRDFSYIL